MEPFDIDKIIKNKILESCDLHDHELDAAKPFVWAAVQNQIMRKSSLKLYHLAAAVVFLIISFSLVYYSIQKRHKYEIEMLSAKIDQMQKNYFSQAEMLNTKNNQVASLKNKLISVELRLTDLLKLKSLPPKEAIVHLTDTVYLKQIEYITSVSDPIKSKEIDAGTLGDQMEQTETVIPPELETDDMIFPSYSSQGNRHKSETIKFKFGSLTARRK